MKTILTQAFCLLSFIGLTQKEATHWNFGRRASLDFSNGSPIYQNGSELDASEGNATISDENGNLLFYTDGITVFNSQHDTMTNGSGLKGDISSAQSAVIVPQPGTNFYYIFTVDNNAQVNGMQYSVVDMTAQGGLGEVTSEKNIQLVDTTTEQIGAVKHANCEDIWIVTHKWNSNEYHAFLLNSDSLNSTPVISNVGPKYYSSQYGFSWGYMKFSPDGKKLAFPFPYLGYYQLYDFDNLNGYLGNPLTLTTGNNFGMYGTEFSPDGTKLYGSITGTPGKVYQWDLSAGSEAAINATFTRVGTSSSESCGALQLGLDGKIYFSRFNANYLGVINDPNQAGVACNYLDNGISIFPKIASMGLPTFIANYFYPLTNSFLFENTCEGKPTVFSMADQLTVDSVIWDFDDSTSGTENISHETEPEHTFTSSGTFNVKATIYYNCTSLDINKNVIISPKPVVDLGKDTSLCQANNFTFDVTNPGASYLWHDNSTEPTYTLDQTGIVWVEVNLNGCTASDTIIITNSASMSVEIQDTLATACDRGGGIVDSATAIVNGGVAPYTYVWNTTPEQTGKTAIGLNENTTYTVTVTDANNCIISGEVTIKPLIELSISGTDPSCATCSDGSAVVAIAGNGNPPFTFRWDDPKDQVSQQADSLSAGVYTVFVTDVNGCFNKISIGIGGAIGIEDRNREIITLFPNPTSGILNISGTGIYDKVTVFNSVGELIFKETNTTQLDLSSTPPGIYYLHIEQGRRIFTGKVIVNHN